MSLCKATLHAWSRPIESTLHFVVAARSLATNASTRSGSPSTPRHFLSIADLSPKELSTLVHQASRAKHAIKSGNIPRSSQGTLTGKTVAMMFSKRSTRTRVSTEAAVMYMGGHPMFLGKEDIQLGVGHPLLSSPRAGEHRIVANRLLRDRSTSRSTTQQKLFLR
jgi:hypothetical protein